MKMPPSKPTLEFASRILDRASGEPLQKQLFQALRKKIIALELMPGQLLPSTRQLADQLDISRTTVVRAYEDLLGQGYIKAVDGIGTFVSERPAVNKTVRYEGDAHASIRLSQYAKRLLRIENTTLSSARLPCSELWCHAARLTTNKTVAPNTVETLPRSPTNKARLCR